MARTPVEWLYSLQHFGMKLGLDNIRAVLERLDHPWQAYATVHVAGTNGKGSVAAMLDAMLRAHGERTGLFTSPHLVRPNERVRLDGTDISDDDLDARLVAMRSFLADALADGAIEVHPSFFETVTAVALTAFRDIGCDVAVLEVGLGGRLDATNAVDADVAVITTIDRDHTKTLGGSLDGIAAEKGGIIKPGRPVVSGVTRPGPRDVLVGICKKRGAPWIDATRVAETRVRDDDAFDVVTAEARYERLRPGLPGAHQRDNARTAIVALETVASTRGKKVDPDAVRDGLAAVRWPGRLQWIDGAPAWLLDGAHNASGVAQLAAYLDRMDRPAPVLLFACTREKNLEAILAPLLPRVRALVATRTRVDRTMDPERAVAFAAGRIRSPAAVPDPAEALRYAIDLAGPAGTVLVAGSLYLVGEVLTIREAREAPGPVAM